MRPIKRVSGRWGVSMVIQMINILSDSTQNKYLSNANRSKAWNAL